MFEFNQDIPDCAGLDFLLFDGEKCVSFELVNALNAKYNCSRVRAQFPGINVLCCVCVFIQALVPT